MTALEPHHAAARHRTPDEDTAARTAEDARHRILGRLRHRDVDPEAAEPAHRTVEHLRAEP